MWGACGLRDPSGGHERSFSLSMTPPIAGSSNLSQISSLQLKLKEPVFISPTEIHSFTLSKSVPPGSVSFRRWEWDVCGGGGCACVCVCEGQEEGELSVTNKLEVIVQLQSTRPPPPKKTPQTLRYEDRQAPSSFWQHACFMAIALGLEQAPAWKDGGKVGDGHRRRESQTFSTN